MSGAVLTITVPKSLWLTSNRHAVNRGHRAAIVRDLHQLAVGGATVARLMAVRGPVAAFWTVRYPNGVRTDKGEASNAQPTCKAILDGLVPRWLPDDGPQWVTSETYQRGPNLDRASDHEVTLLLVDQVVPF